MLPGNYKIIVLPGNCSVFALHCKETKAVVLPGNHKVFVLLGNHMSVCCQKTTVSLLCVAREPHVTW